MKAASYDLIYDVETPIEEACKVILPQFGVGIPIFGQQDTTGLVDERVDVQMRLGEQQGHRGIIRKVPTTAMARDAWNGVLEFTVYTRRINAGADGQPLPIDKSVHRSIVARIRRACEYFSDAFNETLLPYHVLSYIEAAETQPQVNLDDALDVSVLPFSCIVSVRTGAWPEL